MSRLVWLKPRPTPPSEGKVQPALLFKRRVSYLQSIILISLHLFRYRLYVCVYLVRLALTKLLLSVHVHLWLARSTKANIVPRLIWVWTVDGHEFDGDLDCRPDLLSPIKAQLISVLTLSSRIADYRLLPTLQHPF